MIRLLSDEHINRRVTTGLRKRLPGLDLARAQEVGLTQTPDPDILDWAASQGRVLVSNDRQTMIGFAYDRVRQGLPMPGLIILRSRLSIGQAIGELEYAIQVGVPDDFRDQVIHLPL